MVFLLEPFEDALGTFVEEYREPLVGIERAAVGIAWTVSEGAFGTARLSFVLRLFGMVANYMRTWGHQIL